MVYHHTDRFDKPYAVFLENSNGQLIEKEITKNNIKTFIEINKENLECNTHIINKLIYLRRLLEVTNEKEMAYQIISNVLHRRETSTQLGKDPSREMTSNQFDAGEAEIKKYIPDFDYQQVLAITTNDDELVKLYQNNSSNYEKLHIYRVIFDDKPDMIESDIIQKFINEAFHIENDYIYQLNPSEYQIVPQYVIDECDVLIKKLESGI